MKKMMSFFLLLAITGIFACQNHSNEKNGAIVQNPAASQPPAPKYTASMVDNRKDPSCGMPVAAGIEDTIHYKGKVLGFCSKECRDDFLKNPEKNIAAADLKK
ncbi:MAG: YHS domain-containing protein [Bacteroidota bacterium]|nr:YHS domain-containing protein [Bacteroidota bacterium]